MQVGKVYNIKLLLSVLPGALSTQPAAVSMFAAEFTLFKQMGNQIGVNHIMCECTCTLFWVNFFLWKILLPTLLLTHIVNSCNNDQYNGN